MFKIDKFSFKNWLTFIIIATSVAGTIVLSGMLIAQILPENLHIQPVAETSHNFPSKKQKFQSSDSSTKVEPSPKLLELLPKPAKLIQSSKPIPQNYKKDRKEQNIIANNKNVGTSLVLTSQMAAILMGMLKPCMFQSLPWCEIVGKSWVVRAS